jgi:DNA-binding transcriptional regulator YdaS (Cro superfamily)
MDEDHVYARALDSASARVGGVDELAGQLGVSAEQVRNWIAGRGRPDTPMLLRIVALALGEDPPA